MLVCRTAAVKRHSALVGELSSPPSGAAVAWIATGRTSLPALASGAATIGASLAK